MFRQKNPCKVTTNSQGKHYNELTKKALQQIYKDTCLRRIYQVCVLRVTTNLQGSVTTNLQGNLYNEFTRKWLQQIYKDTCITRNIPDPCFPLRRIYYDYIWIPENQIPNPQSLLPITSYPFYPIPPFSHLSYFLLNPKLQLNP